MTFLEQWRLHALLKHPNGYHDKLNHKKVVAYETYPEFCACHKKEAIPDSLEEIQASALLMSGENARLKLFQNKINDLLDRANDPDIQLTETEKELRADHSLYLGSTRKRSRREFEINALKYL